MLLLLGLGHMDLNKSVLLLKLLYYPLIFHVSSFPKYQKTRTKQVVWEGIDHHSRQIFSA